MVTPTWPRLRLGGLWGPSNVGHNVGRVSVLSSWTVGAALEGAVAGKKGAFVSCWGPGCFPARMKEGLKKH